MNFLIETGIVQSTTKSRAVDVVAEAISNPLVNPDLRPHQFISWALGETRALSTDSSLTGQIFELVVATLLVRESIVPFYIQTQVTLIPDINFDLLIWTSEAGPICISLKTSLRERYKQADLEAMALKSVHRRGQSHLVTLDEVEAERLRKKISTGDVQNLDSVTVATKTGMDDLVFNLSNLTSTEAPTLPMVGSHRGCVNRPWSARIT